MGTGGISRHPLGLIRSLEINWRLFFVQVLVQKGLGLAILSMDFIQLQQY